MRDGEPKAIHLKDYRPPGFRTVSTHLTFELNEGVTRVTNAMQVVREDASASELALHGQQLTLVSVALDGRSLSHDEYTVDEAFLRIPNLGDKAELTVVTDIEPEENTSLEGLYKSGDMYCTQCEAEGFRKITYFQDRPDVSATYRTTIIADRSKYPVLLSNGNPVDRAELDGGRHSVTWEDPFPKPSYLFALVAGDLASMEDQFVTMSGREVKLQIFSETHNIGQCDYAMDALKRSMRWDEEVYGREYDLDIFMIVAVESFNMGAMENKGLNVFNISCVLASPDTATDLSYQRVEAVVAHEYFHNWSGNRVTCRDWFQLSLKEGFTVFRDATFSADMNSSAVCRIDEVANLRAQQFPEDAGPLAHPVRPSSYIEISNFYTRTVYEKGAEVVRMLHTLVGPEAFRRGTDLYFDRHDGSAATTDDFLRAMQDVTEVDLAQFQRWYDQAGTPQLRVQSRFEGDTLSLEIHQTCEPSAGQAVKEPFHIPVLLGLVGSEGRASSLDKLTLSSDADTEVRGDSLLVHVRDQRVAVRFSGLQARPAVSFLRGFTAPVRVAFERASSELEVLVRSDSDGFARWDAMQERAGQEVMSVMQGASVSASFVELHAALLAQAQGDAPNDEERLLLAQLLALPGEESLLGRVEGVDVVAICEARDAVQEAVSKNALDGWRALAEKNRSSEPYAPNLAGFAGRELLGLAFRNLSVAEEPDALVALLRKEYADADNLTDRLTALSAAVQSSRVPAEVREELLSHFYDRWKGEALVVNEWLSLQARSPFATIEGLEALERHEAFDIKTPNKARAVYRDFATRNHRVFHAADGSGYRFLSDRIQRLDAINPQVASRLARPLASWRRYDAGRQALIRDALEQIARVPKLSKDVYEIVTKSLAD